MRAVGENSRRRVKIRKVRSAERFPAVPRNAKPFITSTLKNLQDGPANGTRDALLHSAQQLGNGAIVERLSGGRSFFDVRACGEGSKGYVGKRDAHNTNEFGSGQRRTKQSGYHQPPTPAERANKLAGRCLHFCPPIFPHGISIFQLLFPRRFT
jgi:hypothetical protein